MKSVGVIGTGNWGTTVGLLISKNVLKYESIFNKTVIIWGIEESHEGKTMCELINEENENKKYLPGIILNDNLKYTSKFEDFSDIDIIIVALPHQFINTLYSFEKYLKKDIIVLSVVKGVIEETMTFSLVSEYVNNNWNCKTNVLMGANIAGLVARGISGDIMCKSEGTLGYSDENTKEILYKMLNCPIYKISCTKDIVGVELFGSLKNIIALGYGLIEGLGGSINTTTAFLRCGLLEIKNFYAFFPGTSVQTLFESCGVADLIVSCSSGRNYKYGKAKATEGISVEDFEKRIGNQKIQGVGTVNCIYNYLLVKDCIDEFVIFQTIWQIFCDNEECIRILDCF